MKSIERKKARYLRKQGRSLREITHSIHCAKSSISKWICDIPLSVKQILRLKSNQDKGRAKAAQHPNGPKKKWEKIRNDIRNTAKRDIPKSYSHKLLKNVGAALYWAEGYNASRNSIIFANTDPRMIRLMMLFFRQVCKVPEEKFRGKVFIHPHLNIKAAEKYWSDVSKISLNQFNKPLLAVSRSSQGKRDTLPIGTFSILIGDVYTCSRIKGWIDGLSAWSPVGG
ncbi:MAG: hypothetical protein KKH77_07235 [Candidatus Omnitrophica bacterium]|nr:hypothetical protein [Candidatus Omnitrophota bacterium]